MQHLGVSGAVRPIYGSLGVKRLSGNQFSVDVTTTYFFQVYFKIPPTPQPPFRYFGLATSMFHTLLFNSE